MMLLQARFESYPQNKEAGIQRVHAQWSGEIIISKESTLVDEGPGVKITS